MSQGNIQVTLDEQPGDTPDEEVPLDDGEEAPPEALSYNDAETNLVEIFEAHPDGLDALKDIANQVYDDFTADRESTSEYRDRMAGIWSLFVGMLPEKEYPFEDAANPHMPILLESITRITFRAIDELFGDWQNVVGIVPVGPADADVAQVLTLHNNWQMRVKITDFKRQMHKALMGFFLLGDVTVHSYFDPTRRVNVHEMLTPDQFVTPYLSASATPDYGDMPHYTKVLSYHKHTLQQMRDTWANVDEVIERSSPSWSDEPEEVMGRVQAEAMGVDPESSSTAPYKILWYEGYLELPGQDRDRFCQVIMDHNTKHVLKLCIQEEPDWADAQRHQQQEAELAAYRQAAVEHQNLLQSQQQAQALVQGAAQDLAARGELGPMQRQVIQGHLGDSGDVPPPPQPPSWVNDPNDPSEAPEPPRSAPILMFSHGVCIESLFGNLGFGFGSIVADLNRAANTALSQFTDSATFANQGFFLTPQNVEFTKEPEVSPGAFIRIPGLNPDQMEAIRQIQMPQPSAALKDVFELMQALGQSSVQAPEALSGEPGKSGETYRGLSERIEQATKQLSVPTRKFGDMVAQIYINNAKLNALNLPDGEIETVIAQQTTVPQDVGSPLMEIAKRGRELYAQGYQVEIKSDMRFTSQAQRIQEALQVVALASPNGAMQGNQPLLQYGLKKAFEAMGRRDLIPFLGPMLPPPQTPLGLPPPPPPGMPVAAPPAQGAPAKPGMPAGPNKPQPPPHQPAQPGQPGIQ